MGELVAKFAVGFDGWFESGGFVAVRSSTGYEGLLILFKKTVVDL